MHVQSMRLEGGQEVLVARARTDEGKSGFGFSFRLDAAEARHMAEWDAGLRPERPTCQVLLDHPWERSVCNGVPVPWDLEAGFANLKWL